MSTPKLQAFYKSRIWENFVKRLRIERATDDGTLLCACCGKPILKAYDCIGHHITELTDNNVDDVMISLNPDNVDLVHFKCHNKIHERFGYGNSVRTIQCVYIVWGSPCAGKRTWVHDTADSNDLIVDIDKLWAAVRADSCSDKEKPNAIKTNVFALRDQLLDMIRVRRGRWHNAYIIGGYPLQGERERLMETVGADKMIFIDTPREVCEARAKAISNEMVGYVAEWYDRYIPPL